MKKRSKKTAAILFAAALATSQMSAPPLSEKTVITAFADVIDSGSCGENVTWTLDDKGILTISGTGAMSENQNELDWHDSERITKIVIGSGVTYINSWTFFYCKNLNEIILDSENPNYCSVEGVLFTKDKKELVAYPFRQAETEYVIPAGVTTIGDYAFQYCTGLKKVTLPDSLTSTGVDAFCGCSGLTSITIPDSIMSIGSGTFSDCSSLTSITIPDSITSIEYGTFKNCSGLTSITIPDSVTSIGMFAFDQCSGLTSITIPDGITSIADAAFRNCSGLTNITIPDSITSIPPHAFYGCSGLTSITIPDSVTEIGQYAFYDCSGLTSITIPDSQIGIGEHTFYGCSGLTSITIPDGVTSIGKFAFYGCSGLTSITIPDGVTSIGQSAFERCTGLSTVTIPDSVTIIRKSAFERCSHLTAVVFESETPPVIDFGPFDLTFYDFFIYVPANAIDAYRELPGLSDYWNQITTNQLADGQYTQTSEKNGTYYTRFVFVTPKTELAGKSKAKFTVNYKGTNYTFNTNKYYTGMISNGVMFTPISADSVLFVVTVKSSSYSSKLKCKLDFE